MIRSPVHVQIREYIDRRRFGKLFKQVPHTSFPSTYPQLSTASQSRHLSCTRTNTKVCIDMNMKSNSKRVRFAPTCQVVVVVDRTKGLQDKLWYSGDDVDNFKLHSQLYADEVKKSLSDGSFCGDLGDILGLEKFLFKRSYYGRRRLLMSAVLEEQAWQRLSKEMRRRRGLSGDVDGHNSQIRLANIAEKNSRWAKERASVSALALESDLLP